MLSQDQLRDFQEQGFLVLDQAIDQKTVLDPLIKEYETLLSDMRANWIAEGALDPSAPAETFEDIIRTAYSAGLDYFPRW